MSLVDQMMHMMERYADHLEELVEERTKQLAEEEKKTNELLCRMLPKYVENYFLCVKRCFLSHSLSVHAPKITTVQYVDHLECTVHCKANNNLLFYDHVKG